MEEKIEKTKPETKQKVNPMHGSQKEETKEEIIEDIKESGVPKVQAKVEEKLDEKEQKPVAEKKADEPKKEEKKKLKVEEKKKIAFANGENIPISTKQSIEICRFIKGKRIGDAIRDLESVIRLKKAIPMRGEYPHRKGKIGSGKFPTKAAKNFIILLKTLVGNSSGMNDPIISEAISNFGSRPLGRFGRVKKKRTNIKIVAKEKVNKKKIKKPNNQKKQTHKEEKK